MGISVYSSGDSGLLVKGMISFSTTRSLIWYCISHKEGNSENSISGKTIKDSNYNEIIEGYARCW